MPGAGTDASLPYHEPGITTILVQASFLLLLNAINAVLDKLLHCGLLGQVLVGIAWGTPGAKWLSASAEEAVVQSGYLGLLLLVYQGGLHTSFQSLKVNLFLSACIAFTGIVVPIGLSYTLQALLNASPLQAFAAGAALCSTSLGTTFTVLGSSGLSSSRLGVVLTSAAMMDDVVGLVMVQVISNLGGSDFSWLVISRPVLVPVAFALITPLVCLFIVKPLTLLLNGHRQVHANSVANRYLTRPGVALAVHTLLLIALVASATYAGTSNLFAAYIAGASISWWDSEVLHPKVDGSAASEGAHTNTAGSVVYQTFYHAPVSKIFQPLFFASIGFSIPITRMFSGAILWRGIVYTVLMAFAKFVCGLWLVRFAVGATDSQSKPLQLLLKMENISIPHLWGKRKVQPEIKKKSKDEGKHTNVNGAPSEAHEASTATTPATASWIDTSSPNSSPNPPKPASLHPPLILALAMCARGEIGFLISGVAESSGIFRGQGQSSDGPSDIFLVVTWAIVLCTIIGPLGVGLCVRRVKQLQERKDREQEGVGTDVLGVWGVS